MSEAGGTAGDGGAAGEGNAGNGAATPWTEGLSPEHLALVESKGWESPNDAVSAFAAANVSADAKGPEWTDHLNDENKEFVAGRAWGSADVAINSYREYQKLFTADKAGRTVHLPSGPEDEDGRNALFAALGRPANAEEYGFEPPEGMLPDDVSWWKTTMHKHGLSADQAKGVFADYTSEGATRTEAETLEANQTAAAHQAALQKEYGNALPAKQMLAKKALVKFGGEGADAFVSLLGDAASFKFLVSVGDALSEDSGVFDGELTKGGFEMSPAEAKAAYDKQMLDKEFVAALSDPQNPGHAHATATRRKFLSDMTGVDLTNI